MLSSNLFTLQTWASQKIRSLSKGRIDDPSILLDVLMDTPSNGEVVEGCLVNIERNGDGSDFATQFIRWACTIPYIVPTDCSQFPCVLALSCSYAPHILALDWSHPHA